MLHAFYLFFKLKFEAAFTRAYTAVKCRRNFRVETYEDARVVGLLLASSGFRCCTCCTLIQSITNMNKNIYTGAFDQPYLINKKIGTFFFT